MAIFEKKWFRFIIFIVLLAATFVSMAVVLFSDAMSGTNMMGGALMFGVFAVVGQLFLFLAFDMLYDIDNGFLRFLRMVFIILGFLICLACGLACEIVYSLTPMPELSPWLRGFCGLWLAYGVISFYLYYFCNYNFWPFAVTPLIQIFAFIGSYAVTVIFAYVGDAAGDFCYGYPVLIACAVAFIVMCIILKKMGLPFDIDLSLPKAKPQNSGYKPTVNGEGGDYRKEDKNYQALKKAVDKAILNALHSMVGEGQYGRITECYYGGGTNIKGTVTLSGEVRVSGLVHYELTSNSPTLSSHDISDDIQRLVDDLNEKIEDNIDDEVYSLSSEYLGYDNGVDIDCNVQIKMK
ncbi:MAG: hypothetical protein K2N30_01360 [Clostridia bacterium]|nr:hypothetical protein [Clostridia bacterium]